jgi:hypothetical protein
MPICGDKPQILGAINFITLLPFIYKNKSLPLLREFRYYWQAGVFQSA